MTKLVKSGIFLVIIWAFLVNFSYASTLNRSVESIVRDLADPTIIFLPARNQYLLSGTYGNTNYFPLFISDNGKDFKRVFDLFPSNSVNNSQKNLSTITALSLKSTKSESSKFCHLWAPDFHLNERGQLVILFSGARDADKCGPEKIPLVTTFRMILNQSDFSVIEPPTLVDYNRYFSFFSFLRFRTQLNAVSFENRGCIDNGKPMSENCERTIRIDTNWYIEPMYGQNYLFYVWFGHKADNGNLISSYQPERGKLVRHVEPKLNQYEGIAEAPDVFFRNGYYYLVFSHGGYNLSYGLSYIMGRSLSELTTDKPHFPILVPKFNSNRINCSSGYSGQQIVFAGGHSKTIQIGSEFYMYYHLNELVDFGGTNCHHLHSRHTVRQKLEFMPDGKIVPLN